MILNLDDQIIARDSIREILAMAIQIDYQSDAYF
jgi:hypothetical protein